MTDNKTLDTLVKYFSAREVETTDLPARFPAGVSGQPRPTGKSSEPLPRPYYVQDTLNLEVLDILPRHKVNPCKTKYIVGGCGCKRIILPHSCHRYDCEPCAPWTGRQRARRVYSYFKGKTVCYTIFTVPLELRHKFVKPKAWSKIRSLAWKILKDHFGACYGVEASHPVGKRIGIFHPHLNFLWISDKSVSHFIDVVTLRILWAHALGVLPAHVWKLFLANPKKVLATIRIDHTNVKHAYSRIDYKVRHWCSYVTRTFPGFGYWVGRIRWHGCKPIKSKIERSICPDCGEPIKCIGEIDPAVVADYYSHGWLLGLDPPWYDNRNIIRYKSKGKKHVRRTEDV